MTAHRSTLRRMTMALAIAYLLVLQAIIGGIASGAHAAGLASGTMDPAICRGAQDAPGPGDSTHHTPECCFTGCQINAVGSLPPVPMTGIGVPAPQPAVRIEPTAPLHHPAGLERSPRHARAPPLA